MMIFATKILVMGLPGSGKTTFADELKLYLTNKKFTVDRINADEIRTKFNDWDFSETGRLRQAERMSNLANSYSDYVIADFIAPTPESRNIFNADILIWMDTILEGRFADTNSIFVIPSYDFRITTKDSIKWVKKIGSCL